MIGRFKRAAEVNDVAAAAGRARTTADEIVDACVEARVPATIVGNGAELPQFDHLVDARGVRAASRARRGSGRARRSASTACPTASWSRRRRRPRDVADARPRHDEQPRRARRRGRSPGVRVLDFTAFWAGPVRDRVAGGDGRRRDQGRGGAAARRHPVQRGGAPARRPALLREVGAVPRVATSASAASRSTSAIPTASRSRSSSSRASDVVVENFTPRVLEQFGLDYDDGARAAARRRDVAHARVRAHRPVARPSRLRADDGTAHRHGVGHRLRGRSADHPRRPRRSDGRHARRARDRRRARAPRPHRRGSARRGAARRGRDRGHRRAGDPLRDRRDAARTAAGAGGVYRCAGDDAWVAVDADARPDAAEDERAAWCATRDRRRRRRRAARRRRSRRGRWCPAYATLDDPQLRARGFFEPIEQPVRRHAGVPDVADAPVGRTAHATGPARRRRSASTPTRCCATSSASPTTSSRACAPST